MQFSKAQRKYPETYYPRLFHNLNALQFHNMLVFKIYEGYLLNCFLSFNLNQSDWFRFF